MHLKIIQRNGYSKYYGFKKQNHPGVLSGMIPAVKKKPIE